MIGPSHARPPDAFDLTDDELQGIEEATAEH